MEYVSSLDELTHLELWGTSVGDDGLERLSRLKSLEVLELSGSAVTDSGMVHLENMQNLQRLHLHRTAVSDVGLESLVRLTNLEHLSVGPEVSKTGATKLKNSLPKCHIECWDKGGGLKFSLP